MIGVTEAEAIITARLPAASAVLRPLEALGREVLAEDLVNTDPLPPFDRVAMDGIAIAFASWQAGQRCFAVAGIQAAGAPQLSLSDATQCLEVMTGAMLPLGCDTVIPYEQLQRGTNEMRLPETPPLSCGQNVHHKGSDYAPGSLLLPAGTVLSGPQWAVAASLGKARLQLGCRPAIAIVSTGDELVPVDTTPLPHQIRLSNPYLIEADLRARGFDVITRCHLPDSETVLAEKLQNLLADNSVLILSGGVSMGKFDLLPEILQQLGVSCHFHKIRQKPGKPMWFGTGPKDQLVFALPGNPVSVAVCLHRYVLPALQQMLGQPPAPRPFAVLQQEIVFKKPLVNFLPVRVDYAPNGQIQAWPVAMNGSGDFASLARSDGFLELPAEPERFVAQEAYPLWRWTN
ncbi:MAG: molybdopterin molybdotransferase MoeA [Candidatus Sericytochromatia bacterium]|nr:molybdopterin molybdotransferase MoeA [Candidatus Sericytochromatia bacterium]